MHDDDDRRQPNSVARLHSAKGNLMPCNFSAVFIFMYGVNARLQGRPPGKTHDSLSDEKWVEKRKIGTHCLTHYTRRTRRRFRQSGNSASLGGTQKEKTEHESTRTLGNVTLREWGITG